MRRTDLFGVTKEAVRSWLQHRTFEQGAALAYYGVFALAPTLVIAIAAAGMLFGQKAAQGQLASRLDQVVGPAVAQAIADTLDNVHVRRSGGVATLIGFGLLAFGATGVFIQLQTTLNSLWGVQPKAGGVVWAVVRARLLAFALVACIGGLLLVSLAASTALSAVRAYLPPSSISETFYLWEGLHWALSLGLLTVLFAMIYKLLPDVRIAWADVWIGGAVTAVLFVLGNFAIGQYLGRSAASSAYGAAGSLVVVMLWVYYSSQVLLLGAIFTKSFAARRGQLTPADV